jgi:coiled-coil domain-containing protein 115
MLTAQGFISLAKANHSGTKRYGQDYYDFRMQSQKLVSVTEATLESSSAGSRLETDPSVVNVSISKATLDPEPKDPITWFGVLLPTALRSAQASFSQVVDGGIPKVLNVSSQLRLLEIEIGRLRKSIKKLEKSAAAANENLVD